MELNPNHPVTSTLHNEWHKLLVLVMLKFERSAVTLTLDEIRRFAEGPELAIVAHDKHNRIELRIVTLEEAERLARLEGGRPT